MVSHKPQVLALIPARGGSKGIPRKNIKNFAGAPLIAYCIAAAKESALITRLIVSTDDQEIAAVAREWGAETPFLRPADLAQDDTTDLPVFEHALKWLRENEGWQPDIVVQLRPTSPIRPKGLVDQAISLLLANPQADSVRGVVPSGQNPYKMWQLDTASGEMRPLLQVPGLAEPFNAPRQSLPQTFWQTGHIDAIRTKVITEQHSMSGKHILPLQIDPRYTVDIDQPSDWPKSEALMSDQALTPSDPLKGRRAFPAKVTTLVLDFDGVFTDDQVITAQDGKEYVCTSRSDGLGLDFLRNQGITQSVILSREENPVVTARARKLKLEVFQGVREKDKALETLIHTRGLNPKEIIFVGNDLPDLVVYPLVGFFACPADARPEVIRRADLVLTHRGGKGAIRELTERILKQNIQSDQEHA
ncbi:MAG: cytidylyltransferase domain-containing protein [Anaerolineaceae bacterium]